MEGVKHAQIYGGDYKKHAWEYYCYWQVARKVMYEVANGDQEAWNALTKEEQYESCSQAINILADRNKVAEVASEIGLH